MHYLGTVYVTKAAWPHMQAAGYGRIVNTTSEGALGMVPKNSSYGSAKGAVLGFTRRPGSRRRAVRHPRERGAPRVQTLACRRPTSSRTCTTRPRRCSRCIDG